jgi:PleD family two-component response regulator
MDSHLILLVDPFKNLLNAYRMILEEEKFLVETAFDTKEACALFGQRQCSAVIVEYIPPYESFREMILWMRETSPDVYLLIVTNAAVEETVYENLLDAGIDDFLLKPCSPQRIIAHIKKGLKQREVFSRLRELESLNLLDPASKDREGLIFNKTFLNRSLKQEIKRSKRHSRTFSLLLIGNPPGERQYNKSVHGSTGSPRTDKGRSINNTLAVGPEPVEGQVDHSDTVSGRGGEPPALFYGELSRLIRKFIREEDFVARNNGEIVLILPETDQAGSKALGGRLSQLIGNHAPFQINDSFHAMAQTLSFQCVTYPDLSHLPEPLATTVEELKKEYSRH